MECGANGPVLGCPLEPVERMTDSCVCPVARQHRHVGFPDVAGVLIAALWAILDPSANCRFLVIVLALGPSRPIEDFDADRP